MSKTAKIERFTSSEVRARYPGPDKHILIAAAGRSVPCMVMAWSVDRLGRSLQDLVGFLSELHALRIDLFLHQQGLDTTTPAGKALGCICRVRAGNHSGTSPCRAGEGQERGQTAWQAS